MSHAPTKSAMDRFHDHLDVCDQCREHPFALCREGDRLLTAAASKSGRTLDKSILSQAVDVIRKHYRGRPR